MASKVEQTISDMFVKKVEERRAAGTLDTMPWARPWDLTKGQNRNIHSGAVYRGGNVFMTAIQGFDSPFWATRKQIKEMGGTINKHPEGLIGTKTVKGEVVEYEMDADYTPIFYWNFPDDAQRKRAKAKGKKAGIFCLFYQVWNVEQTTGLEAHIAAKTVHCEPVNPIEEAQAYVDQWHTKPTISHGGDRAFYRPSGDHVQMPPMDSFHSAEGYYATLFHELGHSTGHAKRLDREGVVNPARYESHEYSYEELVAEMTAGIVCASAGIASDAIINNSAAYLDSWLKALKADPAMLTSAGGKAQKAADMVMGTEFKKAKEKKEKELAAA